MSTRKPWPKDGLYVSELIDVLIDFYEKPDDSLTSSNDWQTTMRNKLFTLKQASANAKITTVDALTDYLHERY